MYALLVVLSLDCSSIWEYLSTYWLKTVVISWEGFFSAKDLEQFSMKTTVA